MEFKGTKGKWIFNQEEMKIKGSGDIEGLTVIANVSAKMDFSRGIGTQIANALLISKAPEMLEMVKLLKDRLEENGLGQLSAVRRANELIEKATTI